MGVFNSKIKDMSLSQAFGAFPTGISKEKAEELWLRYDENGDGQLDMDEAKHMVIDLAELTVEWARSNIENIMAEARLGEESSTEKLLADNKDNIDKAYAMMKDEEVIMKIVKDFDTDGDGQVSKEEFISKATEGYDLLHARAAKRAKTSHVARVHETIDVNGQSLEVVKEDVGRAVFVSINNWFKGDELPFSLATIANNGTIRISGQMGLAPFTGKLASGGVGPETTQALENIRLILKACGCSVEHLLQVTVFISDNDGNMEPGGKLHEMNTAYRAFFGDTPGHRLPARTTVSCGKLPFGALVEIQAQASV